MNKVLVIILVALSLVMVVELGIYYFIPITLKKQKALVTAPTTQASSSSSSIGPTPIPYNFTMSGKRPETLTFSDTLKKLNTFALSNDKTIVDSQISVLFKGEVKSVSSASGIISIHLKGEDGNPQYSALKFDRQYLSIFNTNGKKAELSDLKAGDQVEVSASYTYKTATYSARITKSP